MAARVPVPVDGWFDPAWFESLVQHPQRAVDVNQVALFSVQFRAFPWADLSGPRKCTEVHGRKWGGLRKRTALHCSSPCSSIHWDMPPRWGGLRSTWWF